LKGEQAPTQDAPPIITRRTDHV